MILAPLLSTMSIIKVFRYVDDFLIILQEEQTEDLIDTILSVFSRSGKGLSFTYEQPILNVLQFLDLSIKISDHHICWSYLPRSKKEILNYQSAHSKLIKRGIASSCMYSALKKSCHHTIEQSFSTLVNKLSRSGFPSAMLSEVAGTLIQTCKGSTKRKKSKDLTNIRPLVIPYIHKTSHNLKNVANRYNVPMVFSAPNKLGRICMLVDKNNDSRACCMKNHKVHFVSCILQVVYHLPLSCGKTYVGQTGRCLNDRLREHKQSLQTTTGSHLAIHCRTCGCDPDFCATTVLASHKEKTTREIVEAFWIRKLESKCVSQPSLTLQDSEYEFMGAAAHK